MQAMSIIGALPCMAGLMTENMYAGAVSHSNPMHLQAQTESRLTACCPKPDEAADVHAVLQTHSYISRVSPIAQLADALELAASSDCPDRVDM